MSSSKSSFGFFLVLVVFLGVVLKSVDARCEQSVAVPRQETGDNVDPSTFIETCAANFITQDYRSDWEDSINSIGNSWTVRMASRLHIYMMGLSMFQTNSFRRFAPHHFDRACMIAVRLNGWGVTNTTGFAGRFVTTRFVQTNLPKVYRFSLPFGPTGVATGTASIILSDNQSYTVFEFCFDTGMRTFVVYSRDTDLPQEQLNSIKLHLKAIGYKERHFVDVIPMVQCYASDVVGELCPAGDSADVPIPNPRTFNPIYSIFYPGRVLPVAPLFWKKK